MHTLSRIANAHIPLWLVVLFYGISIWAAILLYMHVHISPMYDITIPAFDGRLLKIEYGSQPSFEDKLYFNSVKDVFIKNRSSFILADLKAMEIKYYQDGELLLDFPIAAKGQEGTWTETPAGLYAVEWKTESHHSSLYNVTMPYSIQFFGNYFIHGWPYHPDGRDVVSSTSAGCIRLKTENAMELHRVARPGMPVLVFEENYTRDGFSYFNSVGEISARSYIAIDLKSDFIFSKKIANPPISIGHLGKMLVALIAGERMFVGMTVTVPDDIITDTDNGRFQPEEKVTLFTLLAAILTEHSPEATEIVMNRIGKNANSTLNSYLRTLGMYNTHIGDPLNRSGNFSTQEDIILLSKYLYFNRSSFLNMSGGKLTATYLTPRHNDLIPKHDLINEEAFIGGFIPYNGDASEGFGLAIFELEFRGMMRPIAITVADSADPIEDIKKILNSIKMDSDQ